MQTYDIAIFHPAARPSDPCLQQLWSGQSRGLVVTGIVKLAQRFLLELLTVRGSMPFQQERGSALLQIVREGRIRNEIDAHVFFHYAVGQIEPNLLADETVQDPTDERYGSIDILGVTFAGSRLSYQVKLNSLAGDSRVLTVPLSDVP